VLHHIGVLFAVEYAKSITDPPEERKGSYKLSSAL
jgi:hypothetical protein